MNTCCSLNCPFIVVCKAYNNGVDRGEECQQATQIIKAAERYKKQQKEKRRRSRD